MRRSVGNTPIAIAGLLAPRFFSTFAVWEREYLVLTGLYYLSASDVSANKLHSQLLRKSLSGLAPEFYSAVP